MLAARAGVRGQATSAYSETPFSRAQRGLCASTIGPEATDGMTGAGAAGHQSLNRRRGVPGQPGQLVGHRIGLAGLLGKSARGGARDAARERRPARAPRRSRRPSGGQRIKQRRGRDRRPDEDAIKYKGVKVHVGIQRAAEALNDGDGPALAIDNSVAGGTAPEPAEHDPDEHREHVAAERGVEGQQVV
jgi:hypothetical protein